MSTIPRPRLAIAAALFAILASSLLLLSGATAAEPSEGAISKASPKIGWGGELASSGIFANAWNNGQTDTPCEAPTCDPFTLTVSDAGSGVSLVIKTRLRTTAAQGNNGTATVRVTDPSGEKKVYTGESGPETDLKTTIKNAANGKYLIDTTASFVCCGTSGHDSTAELTGPGIGTPPSQPSGGSPTTPAPAPTAPPQPQSAPVVTMSIKAPAVSARKVKKSRKVTATLTTSAPLTNVNILFVDKKKKLAGAKLARLEGSKKVTLKLSKSKAKKLKKGGTYQVSAGGTDAQGRSVVATVRVKVKK